MNRCVCCGVIIPEGRQYCPNCGVKSVSEEEKIAKRRKEFLEGLIDYCEYWKDRPDGVYGVVFSILTMFDGCSSVNNFNRVNIKGITNKNELHSEFCELRSKRNEN
jgi:hypothetical protein